MKKRTALYIYSLTSFLFANHNAMGQGNSIRDSLDSTPTFGIYDEMYLVTGIPLNHPVTEYTADAKFQISLRHRLTKSSLPFNTFLFYTYTQKSFWKIYRKSTPFWDINFNPTIGVGKYYIQNNTLKGTAFLQIDHESSGRNGEESRSWNRVVLSGKYFHNEQLAFGVRLWFPFAYKDDNPDLIKYRGIGDLSVDYITNSKKMVVYRPINSRK
jgi:phospholipase A1